MQFETEKIGDVTVVKVQTEVLDAGNAKEFRAGHLPHSGGRCQNRVRYEPS